MSKHSFDRATRFATGVLLSALLLILSASAPLFAQNNFYKSEMMKIYADQLSVGFGWSGYNPSQLSSNVAISGHLVDLTQEQ